VISAVCIHLHGRVNWAHRKSRSSSSLFNPALERSICASAFDSSALTFCSRSRKARSRFSFFFLSASSGSSSVRFSGELEPEAMGCDVKESPALAFRKALKSSSRREEEPTASYRGSEEILRLKSFQTGFSLGRFSRKSAKKSFSAFWAAVRFSGVRKNQQRRKWQDRADRLSPNSFKNSLKRFSLSLSSLAQP